MGILFYPRDIPRTPVSKAVCLLREKHVKYQAIHTHPQNNPVVDSFKEISRLSTRRGGRSVSSPLCSQDWCELSPRLYPCGL